MKKIPCLLLIFVLVGLGAPLALADGGKIVVSAVQGNPTIVRGGVEIPASPGMSCRANDVLKTTPSCSIDISANDKAGCRVLASSELLIAEAGTTKTYLRLNGGNVVLNVDKLPKEFEFKVETPTAVAAVRGTQFWGRVDLGQAQNPVTTFAVREGTVEILAKSVGQTYLVRQGEALDIPKSPSAVPAVRAALPEELAAMAQASSIRTTG